MDLKYIQDINYIDYNMATEMELGHYYKYFDFDKFLDEYVTVS